MLWGIFWLCSAVWTWFFLPQSSEISYEASSEVQPQLRAGTPIHKIICVPAPLLGIKGCFELTSSNAALIKDIPLLNLIGEHAALLAVKPGRFFFVCFLNEFLQWIEMLSQFKYVFFSFCVADGPAIERLEVEVQVGAKAAEKLLKEINIIDELSPEGRTIITKLKKILEPALKSSSSSSSSSSLLSSLFSSSSSSSSYSSSMSKVSLGHITSYIFFFHEKISQNCIWNDTLL